MSSSESALVRAFLVLNARRSVDLSGIVITSLSGFVKASIAYSSLFCNSSATILRRLVA